MNKKLLILPVMLFMTENLLCIADNENTGNSENTEQIQKNSSSNNEKQYEGQNNAIGQTQETENENPEHTLLITSITYSYDASGNRTSKSTRISRPALN